MSYLRHLTPVLAYRQGKHPRFALSCRLPVKQHWRRSFLGNKKTLIRDFGRGAGN